VVPPPVTPPLGPTRADALANCKAGTGRTLTVATSGAQYTSIQAALNDARGGDTVLVKAGTYREKVSFKNSGSASDRCIVLKGDGQAIIDGGRGAGVGITVAGKSYVAVVGMTVQAFHGGGVPTGIAVTGSSNHLDLRNNVVSDIRSSDNAHGISFYGAAATPMSDLFIDGNEIKNCKLGSSESMVLNGNVTKFVVSNNKVHDNDNIGIDFIGFEGTGPNGQDQARDGICVDNLVYNINSYGNPAYGNEHSAGGIYVDGGRDIVIERNRIADADIGIEVASEHGGKSTSNIVVRNNFIAGSFQGNIMIGGYDNQRGSTSNVTIVNNTTFGAGNGELILQYFNKNAVIKNNIFVAKTGQDYVNSTGTGNSGITLENNLYFGASKSSAGSFRDAAAKFLDPKLVSGAKDMHLQAGSPAINAGITVDAGAFDVDGNVRITGGKVDIGAHEKE
jgi:Right handed beta helix region